MAEFIINTSNDEESFWIQMKSRVIQFRFVALTNEQGECLRTREVSQDVTDIRVLKGEKRLINE